MTLHSSWTWLFSHNSSTVQHFLCWQSPAPDTVPRAYKLKPVECLHRQQEHGELHLSLPHWPGWTKWCWCAGMISMHRMLIKGAPWSPIFSLAPQQWVGSTEDKTAENEQLPCHFHSNLSMNTFVYGDKVKYFNCKSHKQHTLKQPLTHAQTELFCSSPLPD